MKNKILILECLFAVLALDLILRWVSVFVVPDLAIPMIQLTHCEWWVIARGCLKVLVSIWLLIWCWHTPVRWLCPLGFLAEGWVIPVLYWGWLLYKKCCNKEKRMILSDTWIWMANMTGGLYVICLVLIYAGKYLSVEWPLWWNSLMTCNVLFLMTWRFFWMWWSIKVLKKYNRYFFVWGGAVLLAGPIVMLFYLLQELRHSYKSALE